jgi:diguanylate cyclase (GGDEF)-like protein
VGELLALGRVLERGGEHDARERLDRCILHVFERVTGELAELARRDPLTGLLNHVAFHTRLAAEARRASRYHGRIAVVLLDVDRFKETNDTDGHAEGDRLLRSLGTALASTARETDAVGRIGGDEFAALLPEATPTSTTAFVERLRTRIPDGLAISAGAAHFPADATTPEQLLALADRRLYEAKAAAKAA